MATFQTDRPKVDMGAASFIQQGVRDVGRESFANLLVNLGSQAFEAKVALDVGKTASETEAAVTAYTDQASLANQAVIDAQNRYISVTEDARFDEEGGYAVQPTADEMKLVNDAKLELARVKRARANGAISFTEMKARVSDITRKGISTMPGRSKEFIDASNEVLGTYSGNIALEQERQSALAASTQATAKQQAEQTEYIYKRAITELNINPTNPDGAQKSMQEVIVEASSQFADQQYVTQVRQNIVGDKLSQEQALMDRNVYSKVTASFLTESHASLRAIQAGINPETGAPMSIEEKTMALQTAKSRIQSEIDNDFGLASETQQYKTLVASVAATFALAEKNLSGKTASDYSTNINTSNTNAMQAAIFNDDVLREAMLMQQVIGSQGMADWVRTNGEADFVYAIRKALSGLPQRLPGSNTPQERAATKGVTIALGEMVKEITGGEWDATEEANVLKVANGLLSNWQPDTPENTQQLMKVLTNPDFAAIGPKLKPESVERIQSTMQDLVTKTLIPGFGEMFDTNTMTLTVSSGGLVVVNTGGADPDTVRDLNALAGTLQESMKGLMHLQGSTNYGDTNQNFATIVKSIAESAGKSRAEAAVLAKKESADFWGWMRKGTGTLEGYKATKAKEAAVTNVPSNKNTDQVLQENKNLDFVDRMLSPDPELVIKNDDGSVSTHKMAYGDADGAFYVYPTIIREGNSLKELDGDAAWGYAMRNKEFIKFDTEAEAKDFAAGSWKKGKSAFK